jgi:hypothetical protein
MDSMALCTHNQNPQACLSCYNARVSAQPRSQPKPTAKMPKLNDVIRAVREQHGGFMKQADVEPTVVNAPVRVGYEKDGSPIQAATKDAPTRGPMPKPVIVAPASAGQAQRVVEPFSYAAQSSQASKTKVLDVQGVKMEVQVPPKHREVMDRLPRHPDAGGRR